MSRYRVGVNAGPVHVSRRVGKGRGQKGLTGVLVWFIVFPFECLGKLFGLMSKSRPKSAPVLRQSLPSTSWWPAPGWYLTQFGYVFWNGQRWTHDAQGRPVF